MFNNAADLFTNTSISKADLEPDLLPQYPGVELVEEVHESSGDLPTTEAVMLPPSLEDAPAA